MAARTALCRRRPASRGLDRAWRALPDRYQPCGSFRGWLFQIARNVLADEARARGRELRPPGPIDSDPVAPVSKPIDTERSEVLRKCIAQLAEKNRILVELRLGGEDYETICRRLGLSAPRAHKLWHKTVALLRSCVKREGA